MPRKKVQVVDETRNIALALKELCEDKGLPTSVVVEAMSEALKKAYFKYSDDYTLPARYPHGMDSTTSPPKRISRGGHPQHAYGRFCSLHPAPLGEGCGSVLW